MVANQALAWTESLMKNPVASGNPGDRSAIRVLIVDDSPVARYFADTALAAAGYTTRTTENLWFSPLIKTFQPSVVLVDQNIGRDQGHLAIKALRNNWLTSDICVALYSSLDANLLDQLAGECGADGFIEKTDDPKQLVARFEQLLNSFQERHP